VDGETGAVRKKSQRGTFMSREEIEGSTSMFVFRDTKHSQHHLEAPNRHRQPSVIGPPNILTQLLSLSLE